MEKFTVEVITTHSNISLRAQVYLKMNFFIQQDKISLFYSISICATVYWKASDVTAYKAMSNDIRITMCTHFTEWHIFTMICENVYIFSLTHADTKRNLKKLIHQNSVIWSYQYFNQILFCFSLALL